MKRNLLKYTIIFFSFVGLFWSCSKDDTNDPADKSTSSKAILVKKIMGTYGDVLIFTYDGNKLQKISGEDGTTYIAFTYIENNITKMEYVGQDEIDLFKYSNNKLSQIKIIAGGKLQETTDYIYNTDGTVDVKESTPQSNGSISVDWSKNYYDSSGNLIKVEDFRYNPHPITTYTYDKKNNPYKNIAGFNVIYGSGSNNLISSTYSDPGSGYTRVSVTNTYEYNSNGYPTLCKSLRDGETETTYYFY